MINCRFRFNFFVFFFAYLSPTMEEIHFFARVCLSVCLSVSKITQKCMMDLDEMLRVDRCLVNF